LANGTNLLATAQVLHTQWLHRRGLFPVSWVELGLREFQNGGRFKHLPLNSAENRGETGMFAEDDVEIKARTTER